MLRGSQEQAKWPDHCTAEQEDESVKADQNKIEYFWQATVKEKVKKKTLEKEFEDGGEKIEKLLMYVKRNPKFVCLEREKQRKRKGAVFYATKSRELHSLGKHTEKGKRNSMLFAADRPR